MTKVCGFCYYINPVSNCLFSIVSCVLCCECAKITKRVSLPSRSLLSVCCFPKRTSLMSRCSSKIDLSLNNLEITGMNKTEGFFSIGFSKVYIVELQRGITLCKVVQNSFTRFFSLMRRMVWNLRGKAGSSVCWKRMMSASWNTQGNTGECNIFIRPTPLNADSDGQHLELNLFTLLNPF